MSWGKAMNDPMESNAVYIGFAKQNVSSGVRDLKAVARTDRSKVVLDCISTLLNSLDDSDFDLSDDKGEGYDKFDLERW